MKNIWDVDNLMGLKKIESPHYNGGFYYQGVMATGQFDALYDYMRGIVEVRIGEMLNPALSKLKVSIWTVDDGVWQGYSDKTLNSEDIESIAKEIDDTYGKTLPTEEEFNKLLNKYGIHGLYTG